MDNMSDELKQLNKEIELTENQIHNQVDSYLKRKGELEQQLSNLGVGQAAIMNKLDGRLGGLKWAVDVLVNGTPF